MGKPPELPDSGPEYTEVVETIREATNDIDLDVGFVTDLLLFVLDNAEDLFSGQTTFFILGSYREHPIRRLHFAERELNSRPMTYAFVLCDLLDPEELAAARSGSSTTPENDSENDGGNSDTAAEESRPMTHCQFYLLATYCDYVVSIFEGRHAGPSVELSELRNNFFGKTHVFTRLYDDIQDRDLGAGDRIDPDVDVSSPYSQPQTDLFVLFQKAGRRYRWRLRSDLAAEIQKLPRT